MKIREDFCCRRNLISSLYLYASDKPERPTLSPDERERVRFAIGSGNARVYKNLCKGRTSPLDEMKLNIPRNPAREAALREEKKRKYEATRSSGVASGSGTVKIQVADIVVLDEAPVVQLEERASVSSPSSPLRKRGKLVGGSGAFAAGRPSTKPATRSGSGKGGPDKYAEFLKEVRASLEMVGASDRSDLAKRMIANFRQYTRVLYNQYLSIEEVAKEVTAASELCEDWEARNQKLEEENEALEFRLAESESRSSKAEEDLKETRKREDLFLGTCSSLRSQMDETRKSCEESLAEAQRRMEASGWRIASLVADLDAANRGFGVDYDLVFCAPDFEPFRESIEQTAGETVLELIKAKYPDLDYSFLEGGGEGVEGAESGGVTRAGDGPGLEAEASEGLAPRTGEADPEPKAQTSSAPPVVQDEDLAGREGQEETPTA